MDRKLTIVLLLALFSLSVDSQNQSQSFEPLDIEKVKADIDTIKQQMDSTFYYIKATARIIKEEVKLFGWKKTIQINSGVFLPFIVFVGLYLIWLVIKKQ